MSNADKRDKGRMASEADRIAAEMIEEGRVIDQAPSGTRPSAELHRAFEPAKPNREQRRRAKPNR